MNVSFMINLIVIIIRCCYIYIVCRNFMYLDIVVYKVLRVSETRGRNGVSEYPQKKSS